MQKIKPLSVHDLAPGDVLLWHSDGLFAKIIQHFDGTRYNHASIVFAVVDDEEFAEQRVLHVESEQRGVALDVVGWHVFERPGRVIVLRPAQEADLRARAAEESLGYMGRPYAAHTLALLSASCAHADRAGWPWWFWPLFMATRPLTLVKFLATRGGKHSLICSELVTRAYRDAGVVLVPDVDPDLVTPGDLWRAAKS